PGKAAGARERQRWLTHRRARCQRPRPRARGSHGARRGRRDGRRRRFRERSRHRHSGERPHRGRRAETRAGPPGLRDPGELDQGLGRAHDGRGGGSRGRHVSHGGPRGGRAEDPGSGGARSRVRAGSRDRLAPCRATPDQPQHLAGLRWLQRGARAGGGRPMTGTTVEGVAVLTGWGQGIQALPADATRAAAGRAVIPLGRPALEGERFRRATRECLLGVAAVDALLREHRISREVITGSATALIYVTGGAYGASNHAWVVADTARPAEPDDRPGERWRGSVSGTLHFPYTAPSVMSGEVAIEFGLTGPYGILIGGAAATVDGLWQATVLLEAGRCERALVLAVETFEDCAELYAPGRWLVGPPRGVESSVGLDALDFIGLAIAREARFGIAMDGSAGRAPPLTSFDSLSRLIGGRTAGA